MDKSPPVNNLGTQLDRVREMHEADESLEGNPEGEDEINVKFLNVKIK